MEVVADLGAGGVTKFDNIEQIREWFETKTEVLITVETSTNRFVSRPKCIRGFLDYVPEESKKVSINGEEYYCNFVEAYSKEKEDFNQQLSDILLEEINKELYRKIYEDLVR